MKTPTKWLKEPLLEWPIPNQAVTRRSLLRVGLQQLGTELNKESDAYNSRMLLGVLWELWDEMTSA